MAERRSILTTADADQAIIDIEQTVAQAVDTDSMVAPVRQSLTTARAFQLSAYGADLFGSCEAGEPGVGNTRRSLRLRLGKLDLALLR